MWRDQLLSIYRTLDIQQRTNSLLKEIDSMIIDDENACDIFSHADKSLKGILCGNLRNVEILLITDINQDYSKDYDNCVYKVDISSNEKSKSVFIKNIYIKCHEATLDLPEEFNQLHALLEKSINQVGQQLNVCLQNKISKNISILYRDITAEFGTSGNPNSVFDLICKNLVDIYPDVSVFGFRQPRKSIRVQLLIKADKNKLKIIGSTDEDDIGGYVSLQNSVCGSLFNFYNSSEKLPEGYYIRKPNGIKTLFYFGDPGTNPYYLKTLPGSRSKSELAVLLVNKSGEPIGALNLESSKEDIFKYTHAKVLSNNCVDIGFLIENLLKMASVRIDIYDGLFSALDTYMKHVIREFRHQIRQPLTVFSGLKEKIKIVVDDCDIREKMIKDIDIGFDHLDNTIHLHDDALKGFLEIKKAIDIREKIDEVLEFMSEEFIDSGIKCHKNIAENLPLINLDNLFNQFFYDLLQNSVQSIMTRKKELSQEEAKLYKPEIKITAELTNPYSLNEDSDSFITQKCKISIWDNGCGIGKDKIKKLGNKGVSFRQGGTGIGLYAFKQYLMLHNSHIYFESELNEWFEVNFIVDCYSNHTDI